MYHTACTGTIIGRKHILSAAHCFDDMTGSSTTNIECSSGEYERRNKLYIGRHDRSVPEHSIDHLLNKHQQVKLRQKVEGILKTGENLVFPFHTCSNLYNHNVWKDVIDVALITTTDGIIFRDLLDLDARFKAIQMMAVIKPPLGSALYGWGCKSCTGDCAPHKQLSATGWGYKSWG